MAGEAASTTAIGTTAMDSDRRQKPRIDCDMPAEARSEDLVVACTIANISEAGCLIEGEAVFGLGNEVELDFVEAGLKVPGRVVWKTFDRAGISFGPLDPAA